MSNNGMASSKHSAAEILDQAEDWLITIQGSDVSIFDMHRFEKWLMADKRHYHCFERVLRRWNQVSELIDSEAHRTLESNLNNARAIFRDADEIPSKTPVVSFTQRMSRRINSYKYSAIAACVLFAFVAVFAFTQLNQVETQRFSAAKGEMLTAELSDGSRIVLSGNTLIETKMMRDERHVKLLSGQAFFDIAKNEQRPFYVEAGETRVKVVGTAFDINKSSRHIRVAVEEGVVEVSKDVTHESYDNKTTTTQITLTRGQMVKTQNSKHADFSAVSEIALEDISPWQNGRLRYNDASLADITADANRFYKNRIVIASEGIEDLRVTASFKVEDIEKTFEDFAMVLPIRINKDSENNIFILEALPQ